MVIIQKPAESFAGAGFSPSSRPTSGPGSIKRLPRTLVIPFVVIVFEELGNSMAQGRFAEENQSLQTLLFDAPVKALQMRIQIGGTRRQYDRFNSCLAQDAAKRLGKSRIAIHDEVAFALQEPVIVDCQIAGICFIQLLWIGGAAGKMHAARGQLHDEEQVIGDQPALAPDLNGREIDGGKHVPVCFQKALPSRVPLGVGGRLISILFEDVGHGISEIPWPRLAKAP